MFMFFVGCDGGMGGIGGGDNPQSLAGAKTLSRPAGYDFSEAVGENASKYYYNIFSRHLLYNLYEIYSINNFTPGAGLLEHIDVENGETYGNFTGNNQYYLYDSLRYTIADVTTTYNYDGSVNSQQITLNVNSTWDWTIKNNATNQSNFFSKIFNSSANGTEETKEYIQSYVENPSNETIIITISTKFYERYSTWEQLYSVPALQSLIPSFGEYYSSDVSENLGDSDVINYWESPYYQQVIEGQTENLTAVNYFQDALEYATYLFVLGYDYVEEDEQGNFTETEDAPLFDFDVQYNDATGGVSDIRVNGWGTQSISIVDALGRVQELYEEQAGFIGLTSKNKEQLARFIQDKVIGQNAMALDQISVTQKTVQIDENNAWGNPVTGNPLKFNRNYKKIIENVINYACSQAPIGYDSEKNQSLTLDNAYPVSKLTDYSGDYFFLNYENNDDSELFKYIEAAEYQSLVLFPQDEDLGKPIEDLWLAFEYYENPDPEKQMAESITINVGFRYFNCSANSGNGEIVAQGEVQKEIKFGKNGEVSGENPDINWVYIGYSLNEQDQYDIALPSGLTMNTGFNNNIGNGVLNPFVSGTVIDAGKASKLITGTDSTREYYKLNASSTYGFYSTLDESKFSVNEAGEDACDFIEIYFDINKDKSATNINYNYKVGIYYFGAQDV